MTASTRVLVGLSVAVLCSRVSAAATEAHVRVPMPQGYTHPVSLRNAQLLLAWWGGTRTVPLTSHYDGTDLIVVVPLDDDVWRPLAPERPDFAYIYLEFVDFVAVRSNSFHWLGSWEDATPSADSQKVTSFRPSFRGGPAATVGPGEERELVLNVRRPQSRQLRIVDDERRPVTDVVVEGEMFWSAHNHCGMPDGGIPLFSNVRPNAEGVLLVPDGDFEYGFELSGGHHLSVVDPFAAYLPRFFTTYFEAGGPEHVVRVHRHTSVDLEVRVSVGGQPGRGVKVLAAVPACGYGGYSLGATDNNGLLRVPDFYPDEVEAICVGDREGQPLFAIAPTGQQRMQVDLAADASVAEPQYCGLP